MNTKTKVILIVVFIGLMLLIPFSYAYITRQINIDNVISFGSLKMEVIETTVENKKEIKINDGYTIDITNNSKVNRNIIIKNVGNHPMFVRVSFNIIGKLNDREIQISDLVDFDFNSNEWILKDGWYYYYKKIDSLESSEKLIMNINFKIDEITKKYEGCKFDLDVNAQAVQSENNSSDVLKAQGWPSN